MERLSRIWGNIEKVRARSPLVHNITNYVAMDLAANCVIAAGASPAMVHAEAEAAEFTGIADALTINIGTLSPPWVKAMLASAAVAGERKKPWVMDPVACGATTYRRRVAQELLALRPMLVRGNASEVLALAVAGTRKSRGVDATDSVEAAEVAARELASAQRCVVAVTGAVDHVTDGEREIHIEGGSPLMPKVTALGCALTAVTGAFLVVEPDPLEATAAALALFAAAGSAAAKAAAGPGSFRWNFIDALANLDEAALRAGAVVR